MKLKKLREARGLTQATLAKRARITREYVSKLESGRASPTLVTLERIAKSLGLTVAELVE